MNIKLEHIDTEVIGRNVLTIRDFDESVDVRQLEKKYVDEYNPYYVVCKVDAGNVSAIHALEENGFRYAEVQISLYEPKLKRRNVDGYPYKIERVTNELDLQPVLDIAGESFDSDRFSLDAELDKSVSGRRYQAFVKKSFHSPDEEVFRLIDIRDGQTISMKTHKKTSPHEVYTLLAAARKDLKGSGLGFLTDYFYDNMLIDNGITRLRTSISAANMLIARNLLGSGLMKVTAIYVVMRKIYK